MKQQPMSDTILSAHPVDEEVRQAILRILPEIESKHDITILYACESGSRAWGFASPDSDYDIRFIYVHRLPWYLRVRPARDVIELPIDEALDNNGWELRKSLGLLSASNPVLLEWLDSPIVYCERSEVVQRMRELAKRHYSPLKGYHHYWSMAKRNYGEHLQGEMVKLKKYLYVLRPLLAVRWIDCGFEPSPPMRFADLVQATLHDDALLAEINQLLAVKMRANEAKWGERYSLIQAFIEQELQRAPAHLPAKHELAGTDDLDRFLMETILQFDEKR